VMDASDSMMGVLWEDRLPTDPFLLPLRHPQVTHAVIA
jgi:hypothetical protein